MAGSGLWEEPLAAGRAWGGSGRTSKTVRQRERQVQRPWGGNEFGRLDEQQEKQMAGGRGRAVSQK